MKKILGAVVLIPFVSAASAQGTVTVSGTLDLYVGQARIGSATQARLNDGGSSKLAFSGSEDLGGGLRAYFRLDGAFSPDSGIGAGANQSFLFLRESKLGIAGPWGQVEMGRLYAPGFYTALKWSPLQLNSVWSTANLFATNEGQPGLVPFAPRVNNMVRYRTPDMAGFTVDLAAAPGESVNRAENFYGATLAWERGPIFVGYGIHKHMSPLAAGFPAVPTATQVQAVVGTYDFKVVKLGLLAGANKSEDATIPHARFAGVSASANVGPSSRFTLEVVHRDVKGTPRGQRAFTVGYDYFLSKRTSIYGRWLQMQNKGPSSAPLAQSLIAANSGDDLRVIGLGLRHDF